MSLFRKKKNRFSSDHRSQVLLGGVSTWLGDHLGIRRVVGFCTNFGVFPQHFHTPPHHRSLSFRTAFSCFVPQVGSMHITTLYCRSCLITTLQHLLLFETMALKMAALSVKKVYYTTFRLFLSSTTTPQETYRFSSDHRSQVLLGGVSTWLGDHLGIRRVVGFCTNFGVFPQHFHTPPHHRSLSFRTAFSCFFPQVGSMHITTLYCRSCLITTLQHLLLFETMAFKMAAL